MTSNNNKTLKKWHIPFLLFLIIGTYMALSRKGEIENVPYQHAEGAIFGTVYHATYQCDSSLNGKILSELQTITTTIAVVVLPTPSRNCLKAP